MEKLAQIVTKDREREYSHGLIVKIIILLRIYGIS